MAKSRKGVKPSLAATPFPHSQSHAPTTPSGVTVQHHIQQGVFETRTYALPLMPSSDMERLNDVMPDGAQQYFDWVRSQTTHRQQLETKRLEAQIFTERLGQVFAFLIALAYGGAAFWLGTHGADAKVVISFVSAPLVAIVAVFITGRWIGKSENIAKTRILSGKAADQEKQP